MANLNHKEHVAVLLPLIPMISVPGRDFSVVSSTMDVAKTELMEMDWGWVSAQTQTQGRGTQGRPWLSPVGNLFMTLAVRLKTFPPERLSTLSLEAGLALYDCIQTQVNLPRPSHFWLKWPNDLLLNQEKVAGLLIEIHRGHALIGLGCNLVHSPLIEDGGRPAGKLASLPENPWSRLGLGQSFADTLVSRLLEPWGPSEKSDLLKEWSHATRWDQPLLIRERNSKSQQESGWVQPMELTPDGYMQVKREDGSTEILIADYLW